MLLSYLQRGSAGAIVGLAVTALALMPAGAQPMPPPRPDGPGHAWMGRDVSQMALDRFFDKLDPDRTGKITRATYLGDAKKTFDRIDMNHDGKLERSEVELDAIEHHHGRGGPMGGHGMMSMPMSMPMPMCMPMNAGPVMEHQPRGPMPDVARDSNGDITLDAFMKAADARFDAIDTAHTGTITVPMYRAYVKAHPPAGPAWQPMHSMPPAGH